MQHTITIDPRFVLCDTVTTTSVIAHSIAQTIILTRCATKTCIARRIRTRSPARFYSIHIYCCKPHTHTHDDAVEHVMLMAKTARLWSDVVVVCGVYLHTDRAVVFRPAQLVFRSGDHDAEWEWCVHLIRFAVCCVYNVKE